MNRHLRKVSNSTKWPPPSRAAAVSIFFVHYIIIKHMVVRAGKEHFLSVLFQLKIYMPERVSLQIVLDNPLQKPLAFKTPCCAVSKCSSC